MTEGETVELIVVATPAGDYSHPTPWAGLALGAVCFIAAALLARQRAGRHEAAPPPRLRRIVEAALAWSFVYTAMRAPGIVEIDSGPFGGSGFAVVLGLVASAALFMVTALLLLGTADLLLDPLRPRQTPLWLLAGPPLLAAFAIGFLAATGWMEIVTPAPGWREFMLVTGVLIAGLLWWSRLPRAGAEMSRIFD